MKKENLIIILLIIFVVLLGVLYIGKNKNSKYKEGELLICKNKSGKEMLYSDAVEITQNSDVCMGNGVINKKGAFNILNPHCGAFPDFIAIPLEVSEMKGCKPHCLVNIDTHKTKINWMCTGLPEFTEESKKLYNAFSKAAEK